MQTFSEVPYPEIPPVCASRDHFFNMLVDGKCLTCKKEWATEDVMEKIDDEQLRHREAPSDEELDQMYALVGSDSQNYRDAH